MACPYFMPTAPLAGFSDLYNGECGAQAESSIAADLLKTCCNRGYARAVCPRAAESEADAFRFLIKARRDQIVDVAWASERNHHPVAVGCLSVNPLAGHPGGAAPGNNGRTPLERQAHVYASAYLRQIGRN